MHKKAEKSPKPEIAISVDLYWPTDIFQLVFKIARTELTLRSRFQILRSRICAQFAISNFV